MSGEAWRRILRKDADLTQHILDAEMRRERAAEGGRGERDTQEGAAVVAAVPPAVLLDAVRFLRDEAA